MALAPATRVSVVRDRPIARGRYVLYWMIAARRTEANPALEHAVAQAKALGVPLLVFEALRAGYRWANDRLHAFVLDGMRDNAAACAAADVTYLPYVEPRPGAGAGLLAALAADAALVVTDEFPCFFLPHMVAAAAGKLDVRVEQVDGNGLMPLRAHPHAFVTAMAFRRYWQGQLAPHLAFRPAAAPLAEARALGPAVVADDVMRRWPDARAALANPRGLIASLPIDHTVRPSAIRGGAVAGEAAMRGFLADRMARYGEARNQPDDDVASGLSPYLHFGHVGAHQVFAALTAQLNWDPSRLAGAKVNGRREGFWGMPSGAESFMDEFLTWRELGYGFAFHRPDYQAYESLPPWARATLDEHAVDPRPHAYDLATLERAATHDEIWNAAQRQLITEGKIHNYLRMLWGKKILEWSPSPREALDRLIHLNNKYALDGRNPNSYSGIFWTLGRFDRPWAPKRSIFGVIRYMSSANTAKKLKLGGYLARYAAQPTLAL